ncbi:MAG: iron-containing alcohol dehydrogenase [Erysipelotrichaceae bacterium]|nr:iron-containing alcohol dehydrogenase [Erysipelotrichaceae bacterium]
MNIFKKAYFRIYQKTMKFASNFLNFRAPVLLKGEDSLLKIKDVLNENKKQSVLLVSDAFLSSTDYFQELVEDLEKNNIKVSIFNKVIPNPTIDNIEEGLNIYKENKCDAIIAYGGGSPIDCAKGIAARATNPKRPLPKMKGLLKVKHKPAFLIAIPTTAGTGSEATVAAVISNAKTHEKYAINDPKLIPLYAVLDPKLLVSLPGKVTSTTGMDALTHAVEAYIGGSNTKATRKEAKEAVLLIKNNLLKSYQNPTDLEARNNMQIASYKAGLAFTRAYVGYVHAIAHTLGGMYGVPHGLANAVILPHVLRKFGSSCYTRLAELADYISLTDKDKTKKEKAEAFIDFIDELNAQMNIPNKIENVIQEKDLPIMVKRAIKEANPLYPVPDLWDEKDFLEIFKEIM